MDEFQDLNSEGILTNDKVAMPNWKKYLLIAGITLGFILVLIIIIVLIANSGDGNSSKKKVGEIFCQYEISNTVSETKILGEQFKIDKNIDMTIDNKIYKEFFTANGINPLNYKDWYNSNAIKAVNQSIGRLIRSSKDYGAVLLIDQRYDKSEFKPFISKWIKEKAKTYSKSNKFDLLSDIKNFFENAEILDIFLS